MDSLFSSLARVAELVGGRLTGAGDAPVKRVVCDSREDVAGALFAALPGERFDGHAFLENVARAGAAAALVMHSADGLAIPQIVVEDTLAALQRLAKAKRRDFAGPVVAITGSAGKTTTRRLAAAVLEERFATLQPRKNFNNHLGVPLTLLALNAQHRAAVLELGCSDFGEIALLADIADPDVALITNVGAAHLEKLGDLDGVARAKGELFSGCREDATAVVNIDDPRVARIPHRPARRITYGADKSADVRIVGRTPAALGGQRVAIAIRGEVTEVELKLLGAHNAMNAVAAAAVGASLGLLSDEIVRGIGRVSPEAGRLALVSGARKAIVIDDTYNANPTSMRAALAVLAEIGASRRTAAVLGDMLELGDETDAAHVAVGREAAAAGIDLLVTVGHEAALFERGAAEAGLQKKNMKKAADHADAARTVLAWLKEGDAVLVKGSRGMRMEKVVRRLSEEEA